jgi:hypothetical protein
MGRAAIGWFPGGLGSGETPPHHSLTMASKTPPPAHSGTFDDYVRCLRAEVDAAAKVRWEDPVAFLWRARRVGEALLHALRIRHVPGSSHEPSATIDSLLKHEQLRARLGRENLIDLQGLQNLGNTGSHIQGEAINYEHTAGVAAAHLANVVMWFFRTQHPEATVPGEVGRALEVMREPARWQSSPDNLVRRAEERIARLTSDLQRESESARRRDAPGVGAATSPPRLSSGRAVMAALSIALPALGIGVALGRSSDRDERASPVEAMTRIARDFPTVAVTDAAAARDVVAPPVVDASVVPREGVARCPDDTIEIAGRRFDLLPPPAEPRSPAWISLEPYRAETVETSRACFDARVATVEQVLAWRGDLEAAFRRCARPAPSGAAPMPCLTHDEAEAWCRSRNGRLPRIEEWEALARQGDPPDGTHAGRYEWTANPFPPRVFHLRSPNRPGEFVMRERLISPGLASTAHPRYSWHRQAASNRVHSLFVRCAFEPVAPRD